MYVIEYQKRKTKRKPKTTLREETHKAIRALIITLTAMIACLAIFFLITTSQNAQKGYILQQQKMKNEYLKDINSSLKSKITKSTAFTNIQEEEKVNEMKESETKTYVTPEDNLVK